MGAGNGTLMLDILDYIRETQPDVYSRTRYNIIEISSSLASKQLSNLHRRVASAGHADKVNIINKSIFAWDTEVPEPCFFIALEVFDNFAHDVIRYDNTTLQPYQGNVVIDKSGDFFEIYSPDLDPWAAEFMKLRNRTLAGEYVPAWELGYHPLAQPKIWRGLKNSILPFRGNLSDPEYIPTRYLEFLHVLRDYFPEHRLLTSDFTHLSETIPGYNAPVVQTVMENKMIPISTYMAIQGFFDILFPTDFDLAAQLYTAVCGKLIKTASHREFLEVWAEVDATSTKTGENPMLSFYQNAAFMYS
ncbi:Protein midA-like protein [Sugiyamaella lignohabitans]|uniref:Protein arginine methyltransferase NDUFAF7 n=1 Tax=Sugiyamaella lignohabitans TaxID=796027 RepID=A0A167DXQ5_9ASCO|nr:Protein midA-like protein [Sugiyamaella lignohabitans]ANB13421.1 Protein midA-like protein [Sugiyamaella lignohabitans]